MPDPRPDVANVRCMENCRDAAAIQILSEATPGATGEPLEGGAAGSGEAEAVAEIHPGAATYGQYCSICHDVGVGGAPKLGDADQWAAGSQRACPS